MADYTRKQVDVNGSYIFPYTHADAVLYTTLNNLNGINAGTETNVKAVLDALDNTYRRLDSNITSLYNAQGKRGFLYLNGTTTTASMALPTLGSDFYLPVLKYDSSGNITTEWRNAASIATLTNLSNYLPLAGGTLTGALNVSTSSSATDTTKGINFTYGSTTGHIGLSTLLGIYSNGDIAIRPNGGNSAGQGLDITSTSFKYNNTNVSLEGHTHDDRYVTSVSLTDDEASHPNQLMSVKNGVKDYFTVPFATEASKLKVLQTKTYEGILRVDASYSSPYSKSYLYFGSVKTTDLTKPSHVKYKVLAYAPSNANFLLESVVEWYFGNSGIYKGCYIWNNLSSTSYYPFGYHTLFSAKTAAIATSDGSYLGCYFGSSASYGQSANTVARTIKIEVTECNNCTVSLLDDPIWLYNAASVPANFRQPSTSKAFNDGNFTANNISTAVGLLETGDANSNTIGFQLRTNSYSKPMKSALGYGYRLLFTSADKLGWVPANNSTSSNATAVRTPATDLIDPFGEIVYYTGTAAVAADARPGATGLWLQYTFTLGYSFNTTGAALTLTPWKPVYIQCSPEPDDSALILGYTQDLPTTEDNLIYIYLGVAYAATTVELVMNHPVYYYKDGAIRPWLGGTDNHDYSKDYLTTKALGDGGIRFESLYPILYSLDNGSTWITPDYNDGPYVEITVSNGTSIKWKGEVPEETTITQGIGRFYSDVKFEASGNLNSLLYGDDFQNNHVLPNAFSGYEVTGDYNIPMDSDKDPDNYDSLDSYYEDLAITTIYGLFSQSKIVSAKNLVLDTVLTAGCYKGLFSECELLEIAPDFSPTVVAESSCESMFNRCKALTTFTSNLPAETLESNCYSQMFYECTALLEAPEIQATVLADDCCYAMFKGCTSIKTIKSFPEANLAEGCFEAMFMESGVEYIPTLPYLALQPRCFKNMFRNCEKLEHYEAILGRTYAANSCESMFRGCHSLLEAHVGIYYETFYNEPQESVEYSLGVRCFKNMFADCFSVALIEVPLLETATPVTGCYQYMFRNTKSNYWFPGLVINTTAPYCCYGMFQGCAAGGSYSNYTLPIHLNATELSEYCYARMFAGTTFSSGYSPALPATTLASHCYDNMFYNCVLLQRTPALPATTLAEYCYCGMFGKCHSLVSAPALNATTLWSYCYLSMFFDCTSLTIAPALPATTLASSCYRNMFNGCTSLIIAPELNVTTLAASCYSYMFENCSSLVTPPTLPALTLTNSCYYGMFMGCTSLKTAPNLPATTLSSYCYTYMFSGCTSLVEAPEILGTAYLLSCFANMFRNCTALTTASNIQTTSARYDSHDYMFYGCSSLNFIHNLLKTVTNTSTHSSTNSPLTDWLTGVAETGIYVKPDSGVTWTNIGIPAGWTVLTETEYALYQQQHKNDGKPVFIVEATATGSTTYTADKTAEEVYNAFYDGYPVELRLEELTGFYLVSYVCEANYDASNDTYTIYYINTLPTLGIDAHYEFEFKHQGTTITASSKELVTSTLAANLISTAIAGKEDTTSKVTSLSASSTDTQYPSAKCVYDAINTIDLYVVSVNFSSSIGTADKTATEVITAAISGKEVVARTFRSIYGTEFRLTYYNSNISNVGACVVYTRSAAGAITHPNEYSYTTSLSNLQHWIHIGNSVYLYSEEIALINSPNFTGTPTAPTADAQTSTTRIATTAFVHNVCDALKVSIINHGTSDTTFALTPNTYHKWGSVATLNLTLLTASNTDIVNEYMFEFSSPSTPTALTLPNSVKWIQLPSIEANKTYQVSIVNNLAVIGGA